MKHTKGPWKYIGWDGQMEIRTEDNSELGIAFLGNREDGAIPNGKTRANARLIAAAPELLEACKAIGDAMLKTQGFVPNFLEQAINKAEAVKVDTNKGLKVVCCVKECKKVLREGPDDNVSHGYCEPCATKMLWKAGVSQEKITEFVNKHKETVVET